MTENTAALATETVASPGFLGMVLGVIAKPRQTFATLRGNGRRTWIIMAILGMILVTLPFIAQSPIVTQQARELTQEQLANQPGFAEGGVDVEQAANIAASPIITTVLPSVGAIFVQVIGWLIWSGALYLLASMVGGRSSFVQVLQVVIWAWLPYALRSILQTIYIIATQTLIANPGLSGFAGAPTPDPSNPFAAPPSTGTAVLYEFLGQIDIYLFWRLALLVIGITVVTQLSRRKSIGLVLIVWVVFMAVRLIFAAVSVSLSSGLGGG